ncbi:MAG TPA: ATP-binding cassette domain-containing protein [Vicinamibacterales bacterium]|jgi:molybdate transport system ATP-binding protein|nr:ATP-binding cassette domain-containing protein [Vicinamibacterales bacterium]
MIRVVIRHDLGRVRLDVDVALPAGMTALLGPSGAGKTRTLDVIAGLLAPATGLVAIDDEVVTDTARDVAVPPHRRRIGYVFQDSRLFPHLTVRQNLEYGRWFTRRHRSGSITFDGLVSLLALGPLLGRHPARLSGGEQRRVALGRALLSSPRLLLLDEPLGSLDSDKRQEVLPYLDTLIAELRLPMIYVTHDAREIEGRASAIVRIEDGHARLR